MSQQIITAHVLDVIHHGTSYYGNPQYLIQTDRGGFLTKKDAMVAYAATNFLPSTSYENGQYKQVPKLARIVLEKPRKYQYVVSMKEVDQ